MEQIKSEGEKVAKNENIFRYYSKNEENLKKQIAENAILSKLLIPPLRGDESRAEETESEGTQHDADGSSTEDKRTE